MLFSSLHFLLFLPAVIPLYFICRKQTTRNLLLLAASYYFYLVFSIPLVALLLWATLLNFVAARKIHATQSNAARKSLLITSMVGNLGVLFLFKYYNLFAFSLSSIFGMSPESWILTNLVLPMGISFYTFQAMSYTIDVYRRQMEPTNSLLNMALYISFFPQLVAGPIMRGPDLMPQFQEYHYPNIDRIGSGFRLMIFGLAKKSFIADPMGAFATEIFGANTEAWRTGEAMSNISEFSSFAILMGAWAFTIQIYCDFSAYTDIARGVGRMLGFRLMENFDRPYLATSITDFWRRWHISLSTWLRDYLYIPLGGSRAGKLRTHANLMTTMLLGGLWHGANWTFVVWGGLHGVLLSAERAGGRVANSMKYSSKTVVFIRWFVTFNLVCLAWIFFRAGTVTQAWDAICGIAALRGGKEIGWIPLLVLLGLLVTQMAWPKLGDLVDRWQYRLCTRWMCYATLLLLAVLYAGSPSTDFLYFQF